MLKCGVCEAELEVGERVLFNKVGIPVCQPRALYYRSGGGRPYLESMVGHGHLEPKVLVLVPEPTISVH